MDKQLSTAMAVLGLLLAIGMHVQRGIYPRCTGEKSGFSRFVALSF